jgi:hypothetical protein
MYDAFLNLISRMLGLSLIKCQLIEILLLLVHLAQKLALAQKAFHGWLQVLILHQ